MQYVLIAGSIVQSFGGGYAAKRAPLAKMNMLIAVPTVKNTRRLSAGIIIRPGAEQYPRQGTGGFTFWRYKDEDVFGDYTLTICGNSATRSINWS